MALLCPIGPQFFKNDGTVAAGCSLYTRITGTTTPQTAWQNQAGTVAHANPIVLDSAGYPDTASGLIWLTANVEYRFRLEDSAGSLIRQEDDIYGIDSSSLVVPEDYGVVGDGSTDDSTAFANAVAGAAGKTLFLSSGANYRFNSAVSVSSPVVIFGYGAKVNTGALQISAFDITASDVSILGLEIEGGGNSSYNASGKLIVARGTDGGAGVAPTRINRILIKDCRLYEAGRCGVQATYVDKLRVVDNNIHDVAYAGVELLSCNESKVDGNNIKDVTPGTSSNMYGIFFSQTNDADTTRYPQCEQGSACHNHIENVEWEGIDCHGGDEFDFSHNTLINCGDTNAAIAIIHADDSGSTPIVPATNVRVIGNVITGAQQYGIATSAGSATVIHQNITISGNVLENCGVSSTSNDVGGLRIGAARNVSITGNSFNYCAPYGVVVNVQYAANVTINGNTFYRIVSNTETTPSPILIDRGASGTGAIIIGGNTLRLAAAGETYEAVNGVRVGATDGGNIRISENHFDGATTKYNITAAQADGMSTPVVNFGDDAIAVTTGVATANVVVTLPNAHSGNTLYVPSVVIWRATGNTNVLLHAARTSTTSITVTAYTAGGANFAANGDIEFYWSTKGY